MLQVSLVAFWFATALYAAATVLYGYYFLTKRRSYSWYATFLTGAGFLCHTLSVGLRSVAMHGTQLDGANTLILLAWALVLIYFVIEHLIKLKVYGAVLVPCALLMLVVAQLLNALGWGNVASTSVLVENWKVGIHVALILFGYAGFAVGAVAAGAYLIQERQLKLHKTSVLFRRLPSLGGIDGLARRAVAFAFPAYTAGVLLGTLRAVETDPPGWWADPRVILAGVVWLVYAVYIVLRARGKIDARRAAWLSISGAVFVIALAVAARTVSVGFHIFGV